MSSLLSWSGYTSSTLRDRSVQNFQTRRGSSSEGTNDEGVRVKVDITMSEIGDRLCEKGPFHTF